MALIIRVHILQAKGLLHDPLCHGSLYVKVKVGDNELSTRSVRSSSEPAWREEFEFRVEEVVVVQVGVFCEGGEIVGRVEVSVPAATGLVLPTWFSLRPDKGVGGGGDCGDEEESGVSTGKILLSISMNGRSDKSPRAGGDAQLTEPASARPDDKHSFIRTSMENSVPIPEEAESAQLLAGHQERKFLGYNSVSNSRDPSENTENFASSDFEELAGTSDGAEMPKNLTGGILVDQTYRIEPRDMNMLLFEPGSQFSVDLAERQGIVDYQAGTWAWKREDDSQCLTRPVTYTKSASRLVKEVKATEEQKYLTADGKNFAVLARVSTPDVPYGTCFRVSLLYKITPGPQLSSGEECCHLVVSWNIDFYHSTIMKTVIEGSAQQGIKESFAVFADLLPQYVEPVDRSELGPDKDQLLAPLQEEHRSDWAMAVEYLCNFTVISTTFMFLLVISHILLSRRGTGRGLELGGVDLPDTFGELITCTVLVLRAERVFNMVLHFVKARLQRGSDHGIKAQGDGWIVTVALIEGSNLPVLGSSGFSDPYVVFGCNGQTRTSSVKLQTRDPQWNEILEFDAMQEPPSVLDVQVFNFDGPFDVSIPIAHSEINFVTHTSAELADIWVPLHGEVAQASHGCKLHLRIFLDNTKGAAAIREYLSRMEMEIGKKLNLRSPHQNSTFQKMFALPPEEFLINDFACALKRRLPIQGRLFVSARIIGFYANLFGHKTKFFFLWEDIEDIETISPSFATMGSPALLTILRSGRGHDARHGAKSRDEEGRLRFQFQSFSSFNSASKTIVALWRRRASSVEQSAKLEEEDQVSELPEDDQFDQNGKSGGDEDDDSFQDEDGTKLSKAFSAKLPIQVELMMQIFGRGQLEKRVMEKVGCVNYSASQWEAVGPDISRRHVCYRFNRHVSIFGGEACSIQHKAPTCSGGGWLVDEIMTLQGVPFADHFHVHMKYRMTETVACDSAAASQCDFFVGIVWTRRSKFKKRIAKNVCDKLAHRSKEIFELAEREIHSAAPSLRDQVTDGS